MGRKDTAGDEASMLTLGSKFKLSDIKLGIYCEETISDWFLAATYIFKTHKVTSQVDMAVVILNHLPSGEQRRVHDTHPSLMDEEKPFDIIKEFMLEKFAPAQHQRATDAINERSIWTGLPSTLLSDLRAIQDMDSKVNPFVLSCWLARLPESIKYNLLTEKNPTDYEPLATAADLRFHQQRATLQVTAVTEPAKNDAKERRPTNGRPPRRRPTADPAGKLCAYHHTYGAAAIRCATLPNGGSCQFQPVSGN